SSRRAGPGHPVASGTAGPVGGIRRCADRPLSGGRRLLEGGVVSRVQGLILAAGRGSRLGAHTEARPKGMVELAGQPLIRWQCAALAGAGVAPTTIVTGYRHEQI